MAPEYGDTPPWHDVMAAITGPGGVRRRDGLPRAVGGPDPADPAPALLDPGQAAADGHDAGPAARAGTAAALARGRARHVVQLLRTYPNLRRGRDYPFARGGERSVARGYTKAVARARKLIYVEDQYLWGQHVGDVFTEALRRQPRPARDRGGAAVHRPGGVHGPHAAAARPGPGDAADDRAPRPDRVAIYGIENHQGTPGLRARQGVRDRRHLGDRSARTTSTAARGPTTPSCRPSWWTRRRTTTAPTPAGCG